jgi:hypothetical protein
MRLSVIDAGKFGDSSVCAYSEQIANQFFGAVVTMLLNRCMSFDIVTCDDLNEVLFIRYGAGVLGRIRQRKDHDA